MLSSLSCGLAVVVAFSVVVEAVLGDAGAKGKMGRSVSSCWLVVVVLWLVVVGPPLSLPLAAPLLLLVLLLLLLIPPLLSSPCNGCKGIAQSRFSRQTMHWSAITKFFNFGWDKRVQDDQRPEKA